MKIIATILALATLILTAAATPLWAQQVPPHVFIGAVTLENGSTAPNGTSVTAWVDSEQAGSATVSDGRYALLVEQPRGAFWPGKAVSFRIGNVAAAQTATWQQAGTSELNLSLTEAPTTTMAPSVIRDILGENLLRVWGFDNRTKGWFFYDPRPVFEPANTLKVIEQGKAYWVEVHNDQALTLGVCGQQQLYAGSNLMVCHYGTPPSPAPDGQEVFTSSGCGACHTVEGVPGATGQVGPELTHIATVAATRKPPLTAEAYIRESIESPGAFVVEGFPPVMPQLRGQMTDSEFEALVGFLLARQ